MTHLVNEIVSLFKQLFKVFIRHFFEPLLILIWSTACKVSFFDLFDVVCLTFTLQIFDHSCEPIGQYSIHIESPLLPNFVSKEKWHHVVSHVLESSLSLFDGTFHTVGERQEGALLQDAYFYLVNVVGILDVKVLILLPGGRRLKWVQFVDVWIGKDLESGYKVVD